MITLACVLLFGAIICFTDGFSLSFSSLTVIVEIPPNTDKATLDNLSRCGADAFVSNTVLDQHKFLLRENDDSSRQEIPSCNQNLCGLLVPIMSGKHHQERNVARRQKNEDLILFWEIANEKPSSLEGPVMMNIIHPDFTEQAFCIRGEDEYVDFVMNEVLPPNADCLWIPPSYPPNFVQVWRLRTAGLKGIVLSFSDMRKDNDDDMVPFHKVASDIRKMKTPCSPIDYPPIIFMIGEDELPE